MNLELGSLFYLLLVIPLSVISDALRDRWRSAYLNARYDRLYKRWRFHDWTCKYLAFRQLPEQINWLFTRSWLWWRWHLIKWLNLYAPHVFIVYLLWPNLKWYEVALAAVLMYFVWKRIYNYRGAE